MGCGISTPNLPSYMRGGRNSATRKPGQLGCHDDDYDNHKVAIINHRNGDSNAFYLHNDDRLSHDQGISVSSSHAKPQPNLDMGNGQRISVSSPHDKTQPNLDMGNGQRTSVSSPHVNTQAKLDMANGQRISISSSRAMTQPNFDMGNGQRISVSSPSAMTQPNFDRGNGQRISVSSPHMGNGREHDARNNNENTAKRNKEINNHEGQAKDNNDESGDDESHIGNSSWIGSPSFREYCGNSQDSVDSDIGKSDEETKETKTPGGLDHASSKPNEGSDSSGRRRRGSRFQNVFPARRSSVAMKNIINVATCYNPNHATSRIGHGN